MLAKNDTVDMIFSYYVGFQGRMIKALFTVERLKLVVVNCQDCIEEKYQLQCNITSSVITVTSSCDAYSHQLLKYSDGICFECI